MDGIQPLCRFALSRRSILDTLFVNQTPRRPAYATTTDGSVTTLWCINPLGNLSEVAQIHWQNDSAHSNSPSVVVNGQVMLVHNILQRSKSFFGSDSRTFAAGTTRCKWKSGKRGIAHSSVYPDAEQPSSVRFSLNPSSQVWTCYETTAPSKARPSTGSSASAPIVALFFPPQIGLIKSELTVYPSGEAIVDHIILTAILICARKDEWRSAQSALTRNALEASLKAEIRGSLPPYIPTTAARYRVTSPPSLRRPHSTSAARARYVASQAPPPYTSQDEAPRRPR